MLQYKADRQKLELMERVEPRLRVLVLAAGEWFYQKFKKPLIVTSAVRTPDENVAVGAKSQTHVQGRAIDLATHNLSQQEISDLLFFINENFYCTVQAVTVYGDAAHLDHIHIQVCMALTNGWRGFDV